MWSGSKLKTGLEIKDAQMHPHRSQRGYRYRSSENLAIERLQISATTIIPNNPAVQSVTLTLMSSTMAFDAFFETDLMPFFMLVVPA